MVTQTFLKQCRFHPNCYTVYHHRYALHGWASQLRTMINAVEKLHKQNPHTILYDGGDFFHGSAVASKTEGEALIPIMNAFNYDLILPGNWEVR